MGGHSLRCVKRSLSLETTSKILRHTGKIIGMMRSARGRKRPLEGTGEFEEDVPVDSERVRAYHVRSDDTARQRRSREASQVQYNRNASCVPRHEPDDTAATSR